MEIIEATGYKQAARRLGALARAGIPADRRPDGRVCVWRHHLAGIAEPKPQKSAQAPSTHIRYEIGLVIVTGR
jgi:hypothetical protein